MDAVATFDIGTNSVLCLAAELRDGAVVARDDRCIITRLGEGVDVHGALQPAAMERTLGALRELSAVARATSRRAAVGTSALRDATNAADFVRAAEEILGCPIEVISGKREAELTFAGASAGLGVRGERTIVDVGGGSTEIVRGTVGPEEAVSIDIGSVRLTERFLRSDPPTEVEITTLRSAVRAEVARATHILRPEIVGVAGTITTLAALALKMADYDRARVHGYVIAASAVRELADRLARMKVEDRAALVGMPERRALPIAAGALIVAEVLDAARASRLIVSDGGVRYGLAAELLRV